MRVDFSQSNGTSLQKIVSMKQKSRAICANSTSDRIYPTSSLHKLELGFEYCLWIVSRTMSSKSVFQEEKNPRGIPKAPFIVRINKSSDLLLMTDNDYAGKCRRISGWPRWRG